MSNIARPPDVVTQLVEPALSNAIPGTGAPGSRLRALVLDDAFEDLQRLEARYAPLLPELAPIWQALHRTVSKHGKAKR